MRGASHSKKRKPSVATFRMLPVRGASLGLSRSFCRRTAADFILCAWLGLNLASGSSGPPGGRGSCLAVERGVVGEVGMRAAVVGPVVVAELLVKGMWGSMMHVGVGQGAVAGGDGWFVAKNCPSVEMEGCGGFVARGVGGMFLVVAHALMCTRLDLLHVFTRYLAR